MVMAAFRAWLKTLHRPRAHDLCKERRIRLRVSGGTLTGWARTTGHRGWRRGREGRGVDAEAIFDCVADERLRRHGAGQVVVQVRPLRHRLEKRTQLRRPGADGVQITSGAGLSRGP